MQPIVSTISNGKYQNESQLFAEVISDSNVKLMGEMIALRAIQTVLPYDFTAVSKLYKGLIKDLNRISQIDYTITDGYDYAQTACCIDNTIIQPLMYRLRNSHLAYKKIFNVIRL